MSSASFENSVRQARWIAIAALWATLPAAAVDWSPRLAANYLDGRQKEWFAWRPANISGHPCMSCHTGLTYLLARPALRSALAQSEPTSYETGLLDGMRARLDFGPAQAIKVLKEPVASQAVGVEAVFAALFLTLDQPGSVPAQKAFDRLWSLQLRDGEERGAWNWYEFSVDPYETPESRFFGASLAALAAGSASAEYRAQADVKPHLDDLSAYLKRELKSQPLHNRLILLWAASKWTGALDPAARKEIIEETLSRQRSDGSWTLQALGPWKPHPDAPPFSDGGNSYATAVAAFALEQAGVSRADPKLERALAWLRSQQDPKSGSWAAESMNKRRDPESMTGLFMRDAATGFAVLALCEPRQTARR